MLLMQVSLGRKGINAFFNVDEGDSLSLKYGMPVRVAASSEGRDEKSPGWRLGYTSTGVLQISSVAFDRKENAGNIARLHGRLDDGRQATVCAYSEYRVAVLLVE